MSLAPGPETQQPRQDFLGDCLLEGDSELEKRTRRGKRRAILISIVLQILFVAALVLLPLLGKTENIAARVLVYPHVPYSPTRAPHPRDPRPIPQRTISGFFQPTQIPPTIVERDVTPPTPPPLSVAGGDNDISRYTTGDGPGAGIPFGNSSDRPKPPEEPHTPPPPRIVRASDLAQQAKLLTRVQPIYPPLAVETRREGRVELHAIIATDGSIQSLEVLSGDAFFIHPHSPPSASGATAPPPSAASPSRSTPTSPSSTPWPTNRRGADPLMWSSCFSARFQPIPQAYEGTAMCGFTLRLFLRFHPSTRLYSTGSPESLATISRVKSRNLTISFNSVSRPFTACG